MSDITGKVSLMFGKHHIVLKSNINTHMYESKSWNLSQAKYRSKFGFEENPDFKWSLIIINPDCQKSNGDHQYLKEKGRNWKKII